MRASPRSDLRFLEQRGDGVVVHGTGERQKGKQREKLADAEKREIERREERDQFVSYLEASSSLL